MDAANPQTGPAPPRSAFTLIELLVVISVMVVVMGLAVGAFGSFQKDNRLQVAERQLTGFIRQARHTARSSGLPVILRVTAHADADGRISGGTISGITQTPLVDESFEDDAKWHNPVRVFGKTSEPAYTLGRTGHGLKIETDKDPPTVLRWPSLERLRHDFAAEDRSKRLVDSRLRNQGFYLSVAIHMPNILARGTHHRPLLLIGGRQSQVATGAGSMVPTIDDSIAGLLLRTQWRPMQQVENPVPEAGNPQIWTNQTPLVNTYEVIGWIGDGHGRRSTISSVDDTIQQGPALHPTADYTTFMGLPELRLYQLRAADPFASYNPVLGPQALDPQYILRTNRWVDVGLLYDGRFLTLFLDHVAVNRHEATVTLPEEAGFNTLWYGAMQLPATLGLDYSHEAIPEPYFLQDGILDDVRLRRLGTAQSASLPTGVRPWFGAANRRYELVIHPDGRCQQLVVGEDGAAVAQSNGLMLADVDDPGFRLDPQRSPGRSITLSVDATGRLTSTANAVPTRANLGLEP